MLKELPEISVKKRKISQNIQYPVTSWTGDHNCVTVEFFANHLHSYLVGFLTGFHTERVNGACHDPERLCPTVFLFHLAFDQLKSPGGTTFCALEDSALPGVLVYNWHLPRQPEYSFFFDLSSISSLLPCLFFQNRPFVLICIHLYWLISHVCYPATSCYTN